MENGGGKEGWGGRVVMEMEECWRRAGEERWRDEEKEKGGLEEIKERRGEGRRDEVEECWKRAGEKGWRE